MISSPVVIGLIGVVGIHAAWVIGGRAPSLSVRVLVRALLLFGVIMVMALVSADSATSAGGEWVIYLGLPYFAVHRFLKKRNQQAARTNP